MALITSHIYLLPETPPLKVDLDLSNLLKIPHLPPPMHYPCSVLGKGSALNLAELAPESRELGDYAVCSVPTGGR